MQDKKIDDRIMLGNNIFNIKLQKNLGRPSPLFICCKCDEVYSTRNGAKKHFCPKGFTIQNFDIIDIPPIDNSEAIDKDDDNDFQIAMESLIRFVCTSNIPLRALDNQFFREALFHLNKKFDFPKRDTMEKRINDFANCIMTETFKRLRYKSISLLFDSAKKWSKNYQAIIGYTHEGLFLLSLGLTPDNTAKSITDFVKKTLEKLDSNKTTIIAICTDNDNTNKSVFDDKKGLIHQFSEDHFIREPCSAHLGNLAIDDIFNKNSEYYYIVENVKKLLHFSNPTNLKKRGYPHLLTIRWNSLYNSVKYIQKDKNSIYRNSSNSEIQESITKIEEGVSWEILENILEIMNNFIVFIEQDHTNLADLMSGFILTYHELSNIESKLAQLLAKAFFDRFSKNDNLNLAAFAYLLTKEGLEYINKASFDEKEVFINFSIEGLTNYMNIRKTQNQKDIISLYSNYLDNVQIEWFSENKSSYQMWEEVKNDFGVIACEVLMIPCTEAAVERLFAFLSSITSSSMYNSNLELIESRLIIHFDSIFRKAGPIDIKDINESAFSLE